MKCNVTNTITVYSNTNSNTDGVSVHRKQGRRIRWSAWDKWSLSNSTRQTIPAKNSSPPRVLGCLPRLNAILITAKTTTELCSHSKTVRRGPQNDSPQVHSRLHKTTNAECLATRNQVCRSNRFPLETGLCKNTNANPEHNLTTNKKTTTGTWTKMSYDKNMAKRNINLDSTSAPIDPRSLCLE
jgi:hypothetical protein